MMFRCLHFLCPYSWKFRGFQSLIYLGFSRVVRHQCWRLHFLLGFGVDDHRMRRCFGFLRFYTFKIVSERCQVRALSCQSLCLVVAFVIISSWSLIFMWVLGFRCFIFSISYCTIWCADTSISFIRSNLYVIFLTHPVQCGMLIFFKIVALDNVLIPLFLVLLHAQYSLRKMPGAFSTLVISFFSFFLLVSLYFCLYYNSVVII